MGETRHVSMSSIADEPSRGDALEHEAWAVAQATLTLWSADPDHPDPRPCLASGRLDAATAAFFGRALGHDVSGVTLACGPGVTERLLKANAHGMAFGAAVLLDESWAMQSAEHAVLLLAHELVHVVQQGVAPRTGPPAGPTTAVTLTAPREPQFATGPRPSPTGTGRDRAPGTARRGPGHDGAAPSARTVPRTHAGGDAPTSRIHASTPPARCTASARPAARSTARARAERAPLVQ